MGVALMTGDFMLGATGTVTYVDGDRIYGFGHPMYNLGPTQFPLTRADVQRRAARACCLEQDRQLRRCRRHAAAGSRDRRRRPARQRPDDDSDEHHAQLGSHAEPDVQLHRRQGRDVHAAADLPDGRQRAHQLRARRRARRRSPSRAPRRFASTATSRSKTSSPAISRRAPPPHTSRDRSRSC